MYICRIMYIYDTYYTCVTGGQRAPLRRNCIHDINGLFSAVLRNMFGVRRVFISLELPHSCHSWMSGCGR